MNASIKIDHIAVMVNDLEKSLYFYRDLLGLEVVSPEEHNDGAISEMVAIPKVHMREYRLRHPVVSMATPETRDRASHWISSSGSILPVLLNAIRSTMYRVHISVSASKMSRRPTNG